MKIFFKVCLSILLVFKGCQLKEASPQISIPITLIEMGEVVLNESEKGRILIRNVGGSELKILDILPDCSCTVLGDSKFTIAPQDSISVDFQIRSNLPGVFQQKIAIESNSVNNSKILVLVRAKIVDGPSKGDEIYVKKD